MGGGRDGRGRRQTPGRDKRVPRHAGTVTNACNDNRVQSMTYTIIIAKKSLFSPSDSVTKRSLLETGTYIIQA